MNEEFFNILTIIVLIIISFNMILCLIRAAIGPRIADRLLAINMINTKTLLIIALLIRYLKEGFLMDICLIYALVSFIAVVALTRLLHRREDTK